MHVEDDFVFVTSRFRAKTPYFSEKRLCFHVEGRLLTAQLFFHAAQPCFHAAQPCFHAAQSHLLAAQPHFHEAEVALTGHRKLPLRKNPIGIPIRNCYRIL